MTDPVASLHRRLRLLEQKLAAREAELRATQYELQRLALSVKRGRWAEDQLSKAWSSAFGPPGAALWGTRFLGRTIHDRVRRRIDRAREKTAGSRGGDPGLRPTPAGAGAPGGLPDVVCFPIIDWHFRFQRPQQLMSRLGRPERRVFWVAPWFRGTGPAVDAEPLAPGVWEVSLRGPDLDLYGAAPDVPATGVITEALRELARECDVRRAVQIVELPFWWPVVRGLREEPGWPVVYDCMDDHSGFSFHSADATALEAGLIRGADVVLASSRPLEARIARANREAVLVRNACDYEHFASVTHQGSDRPVIGYYGAIADWFDSDLVADLAERQPGWDFILVGSTFAADVARLRSLPNVQLVGERPYAELPRWLSRFDVTVLPFRRTPLTEATNPVKAYEIMAAGLPLVSVPLPEILEFGDLVRLASTPAEFEEQIRAALADRDAGVVERRRAFARQQTWDDRVRSIEGLFPALFERDIR